MFLKALEVALIVLALAFCVTQLVVPAYRGQKLFPLFRRQGKLEKDLQAEVQRGEDTRVKSKISKLKKRG